MKLSLLRKIVLCGALLSAVACQEHVDKAARYVFEHYIHFFEYCAKEVYDNPETPEDIW